MHALELELTCAGMATRRFQTEALHRTTAKSSTPPQRGLGNTILLHDAAENSGAFPTILAAVLLEERLRPP